MTGASFASSSEVSTFNTHTLMLMQWDDVSELQPQTGLLFTPQLIHGHGEAQRNHTDRVKPIKLETTCMTSTLSTANPTWIDLGLHSHRPTISCLSHRTINTHIKLNNYFLHSVYENGGGVKSCMFYLWKLNIPNIMCICISRNYKQKRITKLCKY
jgi:hypothetical protein